MPVPKRKRSRARRDSRFANKGIKACAITACANCQTPLTTHQACGHCGFYKGKKVMFTKLDRVVKRAQVKQERREREGKAKQAEEAASVQEKGQE